MIGDSEGLQVLRKCMWAASAYAQQEPPQGGEGKQIDSIIPAGIRKLSPW
jgi:hypothetical protein